MQLRPSGESSLPDVGMPIRRKGWPLGDECCSHCNLPPHRSADMPIDEPTRQDQHPVRNTGTNGFRQAHLQTFPGGRHLIGRTTPQGEPHTACPPTFLEPDQSPILELRPTQIELFHPGGFRSLDNLPEQHRGRPQIVQPCIGGAVLVIHLFPMIHGQDSRDRPVPLESHPNTDSLSHAGNETLKPLVRLRWKMLTRPGQHDESIK